MHFKGLDLNLLVALDALLEERNVSRAGERIHLSQSAMSGALSRLREHYQDPLLVQIGRTLRLTELAESLVQPVRAILLQIEVAMNPTPAFDPSTSTHAFAVMASDYGSIVLISEALRRFEKTAPHITVEIRPFSDAPLQALEHGDIDLLVMARDFMSEEHPVAPLFTDRFVCVAWSGNSRIGDTISVEQFVSLGHVVVKYGRKGIAHFQEKFFESRGYARRVEVVATSFSAVPHFLLGTDRIAVMHERLAKVYAGVMPLKLLSPPIDMPVLRQAMQWHTYRDKDPASIWLRGQLAQIGAVFIT